MTDAAPDFIQACDTMNIGISPSLAHDLRTPLTCIIGALQTLDQMHASLSADQHDMLVRTALSEANRLDGFITQMLESAKL